MKRICYVTTLGTTIESFFIPQLQHLAKNGFDVTVICSPDISNLGDKLGEGVNYYPVCIPRGISIIEMLKSIIKLKHHFKRQQYDLIQYSTPNAAFCAACAGKGAGIKIRNYHLMGLRYLGANGLLRIALKEVEKLTCSLSTSIECVSKSNLLLGVEQKLFNASKATVVWNGSSGGVNLNRFNIQNRLIWRGQVRKELGCSDSDFVFGFVGRITKDKGINELLKAFLSLKGDSKLLMIGRIENKETLDEKLLNQAIDSKRIIIQEYVDDIERYYSAIDVLVLPSYREGFGMVIAEAAAMGTPAIVSNIPGPIDAVEIGKTAVLIQPKDTQGLRRTMLEYMTGKIKLSSEECSEYIKKSFDSEVLNEKILQRKTDLLEKNSFAEA